jgi:hypothetical protein
MRGHLSATDIADMSGRIWAHLAFMLDAFREEGVPVPSFTGNEMANLATCKRCRGSADGEGRRDGEGGVKRPAQRGKRTFINAGCGG